MKILLLKEEGDARDKLSFALEGRYGASVESWSSLEFGAKQLGIAREKNAPFSLVICDLKTESMQKFDEFQRVSQNLPAIVCADGKDISHQVSVTWNLIGTASRASLLTSLFQVIDHYMETEGAEEFKDRSGFCKIRAKILLSVCPLRGDIFIRLSEMKFVKLFHKGDAFERADWIKYSEQKGVEYLFIKLDQCQEFIEKYRMELEKYLDPARVMDVKEAAQIQDSIHETVQEMGNRIGFTKDVQVLAKAQIRIAVKTMQNSRNLSSLLSRLENEQGRYIASHSTMTGYLACAIASQMEWGSEATMYKLNMAAFLHDITLENDKLALCESLQEAEEGEFTPEEKALFKTHPAKASEIARNFTEVPPDVDVVIMQHHEMVDGSGFPRGINHLHISPLSAVFIVAHEMARYILLRKEKFSLEDFLFDYSAKFTRGNFKKVVEAVRLLRLDDSSEGAA